jgi:hypothetical protein
VVRFRRSCLSISVPQIADRPNPARLPAQCSAHCATFITPPYNSELRRTSAAAISLRYGNQALELKAVREAEQQEVLRRQDIAFTAFFKRYKEGKKPGFPRFKAKARFHSAISGSVMVSSSRSAASASLALQRNTGTVCSRFTH